MRAVSLHRRPQGTVHIPPQGAANRNFDLEQEVARLPVTDLCALDLRLRTEGHVFGALVLELLRIRTTIKRLKIVVENRVTIHLAFSCTFCKCMHILYISSPLTL